MLGRHDAHDALPAGYDWGLRYDAFLRLAEREQAIGGENLVTVRDALTEAIAKIDRSMDEKRRTR